jgi:undecaprenyl-diphosphatase
MAFASFTTFDQYLLGLFNGSNSLFLDSMAQWLTSGLTWIPLYIALFILVMKNNETMAQIALIVGCSLLCIILAGGLTDFVVKPLVARWRPANDPFFKYAVDVVANHRSSDYGFFSAHAANTMSLAVFFSFLVRDRLLGFTLVVWSLINCWTRLFLGLHYPFDILFGILWGIVAGSLSYLVFHHIYFKISPRLNYISSQYSSTGYSKTDIDMVVAVFVLTLAVVMLCAVYTIRLI